MKQLCRVITDQYIGSTFNLHSFEIDEVGADTRPYLQLPAILISCSPSCRWVQRRGRNRCTGANTQVSGPSSPSEALHVGLSIVSTHFFSSSSVPLLTQGIIGYLWWWWGCEVFGTVTVGLCDVEVTFTVVVSIYIHLSPLSITPN